jgi:penicillin-binding protein 2
VTRALAESINTFFYYIGGGHDGFVGLGVERIMAYASRFGFGAPTGIDLPNEASGFLPSKVWKEEAKGERWYIGDTYNVSIGQGDLLVTPLQIASMTSTVANGGTLYQPHILHALESDQGETIATPVVKDAQVVDADAIAIVRDGMRQAVTSGSARRLLSLPVTSAGKTGTAQWSSVKKNHAWFTGFAPFENPEVVITVLVEEGGAGDVVAVPIAQEILAWWFTQFEIASPPPAPVENTLDANPAENYDETNEDDRPV